MPFMSINILKYRKKSIQKYTERWFFTITLIIFQIGAGAQSGGGKISN